MSQEDVWHATHESSSLACGRTVASCTPVAVRTFQRRVAHSECPAIRISVALGRGRFNENPGAIPHGAHKGAPRLLRCQWRLAVAAPRRRQPVRRNALGSPVAPRAVAAANRAAHCLVGSGATTTRAPAPARTREVSRPTGSYVSLSTADIPGNGLGDVVSPDAGVTRAGGKRATPIFCIYLARAFRGDAPGGPRAGVGRGSQPGAPTCMCGAWVGVPREIGPSASARCVREWLPRHQVFARHTSTWGGSSCRWRRCRRALGLVR